MMEGIEHIIIFIIISNIHCFTNNKYSGYADPMCNSYLGLQSRGSSGLYMGWKQHGHRYTSYFWGMYWPMRWASPWLRANYRSAGYADGS